ncbi:hypothetical protein F5I97DRAFT_1342213 [Phlebopus sp. FC_14]|nr:hypothetical protein F5I97DRAFT_1342213 [Phlebopus sp. FC_14]
MALTATAQSALPVWDETIVPALRKRLESESRILAKRMSAASISSLDDSSRSNAPQISGQPSRGQSSSPAGISEPRKSSAIPRPSLQHPRGPQDGRLEHTRVNGASSSSPPAIQRARTYSQPYAYDISLSNGNALPTPDSSRPTSPRMPDVRKPTRIPVVARGRTTSTSSNTHNITPRTENRNGIPYQMPTPETSPDLWAVQEGEHPNSVAPAASVRHQSSNIMNEPPPFSTSSASSTRSRTGDPTLQDYRPSHDSEERPFEHWYRGDVHRNGGVGELRVAKHMEMLQIANYGHSLRKPVRSQTRDASGPIDYGRRRKRADSMGGGTRESLYLDEDRAKDIDMVIDESPLTDIEGDPDTDPETFYDAYIGIDDTVNSSHSAPDAQSKTLTDAHAIQNDIPLTHASVSLVASEPLRSATPSNVPRTSAESTTPASTASGSRPRTISPTTSPISQTSDQSQRKHRAKSPASPASTPKKANAKAKTPPPLSRQKADVRGSVAVYPTPEGDAMMDAIPTWTQPVQKSGNWDEVVLPVVARKKGLDGQYEQADGSPRPKPPEATPIKPAPGTFGYDYTKYRAPREDIPMGEFGQLPEASPAVQDGDQAGPEDDKLQRFIPLPSEPEEPIRLDHRRTVLHPPSSPPPFSQYRHGEVPTINVTRPSSEFQQPPPEDEDVGGGCCKCTIM